MQKTWSALLSFIMAIMSLFPALSINNPITLGEAQSEIYSAYGMTNDMGIITSDDGLSTDSLVTSRLLYSMLKQASNDQFVKSGTMFKIDKEVALKAISDSQEAWATQEFGQPAVEATSQDEIKFSGDFAPAIVAAEIKDGNGNTLQDSYVPLGAESGITQSQIDIAGLLKKLNVSFSVSGFNFNLKVTDTGFNLGVGKDIVNGVRLQKSYEITNLNVSTKFDGNLATRDIKEAYLRADYDLLDVTTLTGSYATSLAVTGDTPMDLMTAAKAGALAFMPNGGNKITVFTFSVPMGSTPFTVSMDINLRITVDGKIQITIESSNVKGIEIINNQVRIINETTYGNQTYDIMADIRVTVGLCFSIKLVNYIIIDAEFEVGLGIKVSAYIQTDTAVYTLDMPLDLAIEIKYPCGGMDGAQFCGNAKLYCLMSVSLGQNSQLMKLAGLQKTWVIFDESNATLYNLHIEENGVCTNGCTRART